MKAIVNKTAPVAALLAVALGVKAEIKVRWYMGGSTTQSANCPMTVRHRYPSCSCREHHTCGQYSRYPYYNHDPWYNSPVRHSSKVYSYRTRNLDEEPFRIQWADREKSILLIPPKAIEVGAELELPDRNNAVIIEYTNTKITLLVDQRLITFPFKLKN